MVLKFSAKVNVLKVVEAEHLKELSKSVKNDLIIYLLLVHVFECNLVNCVILAQVSLHLP